MLDIYATSVDYDASAEASKRFFQTVQNKMHWAAHGHTAAEVIVERADAGEPNMGLTSWSGSNIRRSDVDVSTAASLQVLDVREGRIVGILAFLGPQAVAVVTRSDSGSTSRESTSLR